MTSTPKRSVGRPRRQPLSAEALVSKARQEIQTTQERKQSFDFLEAEDTLAIMSDEEELRKLQSKDIKELQRQAKILWELLQAEQWEQEQTSYGIEVNDEQFLDAPAVSGQMTRKEWLAAHAHLKPKRKNARKVKSIYDIKEKHYERYGLTAEITETTNLDVLEADLEKKMMDREVAERAEQRRLNPHVGKRVRERTVPERKQPVQSFWI